MLDKPEIIAELEAILIYCEAVRRDNNRGRMKLLVRDDIEPRVRKLRDHFGEEELSKCSTIKN